MELAVTIFIASMLLTLIAAAATVISTVWDWDDVVGQISITAMILGYLSTGASGIWAIVSTLSGA